MLASFKTSLSEGAIERYLDRRDTEIQDCLAALNKGNFQTSQDVAHKILGNCKMFGFIELEAIVKRLSAAARAKDSLECRTTLKELQNWILCQSASSLVNSHASDSSPKHWDLST